MADRRDVITQHGSLPQLPPPCKDGKCLKCSACYSRYVERKMNGELDA